MVGRLPPPCEARPPIAAISLRLSGDIAAKPLLAFLLLELSDIVIGVTC